MIVSLRIHNRSQVKLIRICRYISHVQDTNTKMASMIRLSKAKFVMANGNGGDAATLP